MYTHKLFERPFFQVIRLDGVYHFKFFCNFVLKCASVTLSVTLLEMGGNYMPGCKVDPGAPI